MHEPFVEGVAVVVVILVSPVPNEPLGVDRVEGYPSDVALKMNPCIATDDGVHVPLCEEVVMPVDGVYAVQ